MGGAGFPDRLDETGGRLGTPRGPFGPCGKISPWGVGVSSFAFRLRQGYYHHDAVASRPPLR